MSSPPYPPYPPFPPYPQYPAPPPYPPFPPYSATLISGAASALPSPQGSLLPTSGGATTGAVQIPERETTAFAGLDATNPLSIFFNYGRYDILDVTNEGLGQGQNAKVAKFVADATAVRASEIIVNGFASPEDNLANSQLPTHRANAVKNRLDQLFATSAMKPTISVRTTSVLSGDPSTWPALRRADVYIVSRAA